MFGFIKSGMAIAVKASFDSDYKVLRSLPLSLQKKIASNIKSDVNQILQSSDDVHMLKIFALKFKDKRNLAVSFGAKNQTDPMWLEASLCENMCNALLFQKFEISMHILKTMSVWLQVIDMVDS